jgi:FKBP-type peptidyl-prolyl cis-trans isomerase FkpA
MKLSLGLAVVAILIAAVALYFYTSKTGTPQSASESDSQPTAVETSPSPPPQIVWRAAQDAFLNENIKQNGWAQAAEGLQYSIEKKASDDAPMPAPGSRVTVHYEGKLIDGNVFDSSYSRGEPATFPLNGVIQGWQIGVSMMRQGEIWQFAIPAALAYGERGTGPIPPGSTLLFKVELLEVETPAG